MLTGSLHHRPYGSSDGTAILRDALFRQRKCTIRIHNAALNLCHFPNHSFILVSILTTGSAALKQTIVLEPLPKISNSRTGR